MLLGKRLGLVAAALWALVGWAAEKNIVVVIADDLSPTLGCYGDMTAVTPNIDRLAADGTLFRYAFATTASCSASRSVVLSGLHNHRNGHYGHLHSYHKFSSFPWVKTLPVLLAKAGYRTARIGKHHNGPEEVYFFETKIPGNSRSTVEMANNCEEFIKADSDKPFFLYYATSDPHRGGGRANELEHQPDRFGNKPNKGAYPGVQEVFYDPAKVTVPQFLPDTPETRAELAQYYQSTSRVDQGLGRLMEILKKNGKWDNTLILFTSDHGMAFAGGKTTVYEGGLRVPGVIHAPNLITKFTNVTAPAFTGDFLPTILNLLEVETDNPQWIMDGISLLPWLMGDGTKSEVGGWLKRPPDKPIGISWADQDALIDNNWKLMTKPVKGQCDWQEPYGSMTKFDDHYLFDLETDYHELHDRKADSPKIFENMLKMLAEFKSSITTSQMEETGCGKA